MPSTVATCMVWGHPLLWMAIHQPRTQTMATPQTPPPTHSVAGKTSQAPPNLVQTLRGPWRLCWPCLLPVPLKTRQGCGTGSSVFLSHTPVEADIPVLVCPTNNFIIFVVLKMDVNAIPLFLLFPSLNSWLLFYLLSVSVLTSKYALHLCFYQEIKHFPSSWLECQRWKKSYHCWFTFKLSVYASFSPWP